MESPETFPEPALKKVKEEPQEEHNYNTNITEAIYIKKENLEDIYEHKVEIDVKERCDKVDSGQIIPVEVVLKEETPTYTTEECNLSAATDEIKQENEEDSFGTEDKNCYNG